MRGKRLLLLVVLTILPAAAQAAGFHAVVIGCQNYRHLTTLKTPKADANAVADVLEKQYGFTVELLLDKSRDEIMLALSGLRKTMTSEDDSLLIYYAGHGYLDKTTDTGYWQPVDAEKDNPVKWIPSEDITRELKALQIKHILVVADSCYSGSLLRDSGTKLPSGISQDEWLKRMFQRRSRTALTSGGEEPVADGGSSGHSVFAWVFLEVLRGNREILDGDSLFDRIKRPVALNADQTPHYGDIKKAGQDVEQGAFLFVPKELQEGGIPEQPKSTADLSFLQRNGDSASPKMPKQGDTMTDPTTGMELVYVPGDCFWRGSPENEKGRDKDEGPVRVIRVDGFWMGKYEVTQEQWQKVMSANPFNFKKGDSYPVENVSWDDVQDFIKKLNSSTGKSYRLPTEAEWEYACRAKGSGKYCGGDDLDAVAWYDKNSGSSIHAVGGKQANAFGLHDMSGNVWEWCADWYGKYYYASSPQSNPLGPESGSGRVIRGGSWYFSPRVVRSANRDGYAPDNRSFDLGFRLVLSGQQGKTGD
jgi:formylglycine-generating enzyme required for sulfatase activity/uncharacterized caspase-like protein